VEFALLEWADVMLGVQLGAAAVYSVWATASEMFGLTATLCFVVQALFEVTG
jgi:hypothetical protein